MTQTIYKLDAMTSPEDPRDFQADAIFPPLDLPEVYDPRRKLLQVRDQGGQGSCVGQATACVKELQEKKNVEFEEYMSPQFIYNHRYNQEGQGMYPRDSMNIVYKRGILPEAEYPYGKIEKPEEMDEKQLKRALNYKASGYAYVKTIATAKSAIHRSGACIITVPVYQSDERMWKPVRKDTPLNGGHAMTMVGWNKEGFIIRNSWGEEWGDKGYCIFPYSDWGMQGEVWALIDDESSKPDPKYSKWYWKSWRAIKNTFNNLKGWKIPVVVSYVLAVVVTFIETPWILLWIPISFIAIGIWSYIKKLYIAKG